MPPSSCPAGWRLSRRNLGSGPRQRRQAGAGTAGDGPGEDLGDRLGAAVAGAPHDDERLIGLAAALTEAAERLDAAADHSAMTFEDPDVADRIAQLAALPSAPGHTRAGAADQASDDVDDPYCPATGGRHRIDWPTVRLPRGDHSVLVNCAACGQTGELNLVDEDEIDWPADLAG